MAHEFRTTYGGPRFTRRNVSIQTHFNHGKIASCSGFGKSLMGGWGQQMVLAGSCSLQQHAAGSAHAYWEAGCRGGLVQLATIKGKFPL